MKHLQYILVKTFNLHLVQICEWRNSWGVRIANEQFIDCLDTNTLLQFLSNTKELLAKDAIISHKIQFQYIF